jgi:hypothetical protein
METQTRGHRFDAATGTWSPTERYRAQYSATANRILVGQEKAGDRDRIKAAHGNHGRRGKNMKLGTGWTDPDDVRLPKQVVCVRCGATNAVEIDH